MERVRVGIIGCGRISPQYLDNLVKRFGFCLEVVACADIVREAAEACAAEYGIPKACSTEELLADPEVEIAVNLTFAPAHYQVSMAALQAGKHVYTEKPLSLAREEGRRLLEMARSKGLRLGGAPDTFLGAGLQTCRKLLDDGAIGVPVTATALLAIGARTDRYYTYYGGPLFDMGPYYLTALVSLLGPVARVTGSAQIPFATKTVDDPSSPEHGKTYPVSRPGNLAGVLDWASGCVGVISTTCEAFGYHPRLEIYGTEGILYANDPNMFGGPVSLRSRSGELHQVPLTHGYDSRNRGLGVADMAYAIRTGRPHRASAELVYHALDLIEAVHEASREGQHIPIQSRVERPEPIRPGYEPNVWE